MSALELLIMSFGLSMDSFAVSLCKGLAMKKFKFKKALVIAAYFLGFHCVMIIFGYYLGSTFERFINDVDHWIAFFLLLMIGGSMIKEAISGDKNSYTNSFNFKTMAPLAIATSVDALAVGISFSFLKVNLLVAVPIIGIVVFAMAVLGVKLGNIYGDKYENKAKIVGGVILILIGIKILLEHLGIF